MNAKIAAPVAGKPVTLLIGSDRPVDNPHRRRLRVLDLDPAFSAALLANLMLVSTSPCRLAVRNRISGQEFGCMWE
jgi:hypothetical protein